MMTESPYADPAELTLRVGAADAAFLRDLFGLAPGTRSASYLPARLVVDAHVALSDDFAIARIAREAGVPFLIDPETYYLQDTQHPEATWCRLPFATPSSRTPRDLSTTAAQDELVRAVIDYQVQHGATAVIAPYVHIERPDSEWAAVQGALWRRTAVHLKEAGINLPVVAVVAIGWRCLHPLRGFVQLTPMWDALAGLGQAEIALAASKVHMGTSIRDRIAELLVVVRTLSRNYKVTMWQQGILGEACIIEGAAGYECGIGWREKCDLQSRKAQLRRPTDGHPAARPIYIRELGRGVPKARLQLARTQRSTWAKLVCPFPDCCPPGGEDLLADARRHSVVSRVRELEHLGATSATSWRWNYLSQRTEQGLDIAQRLNALAPSSTQTPQIQAESLVALFEIANARRGRRQVVRRTA